MNKSIILALAVSTALAGCAYNPLARPTTGADPARTGGEAMLHINALQEAFVRRDVADDGKCDPITPSYQHVDSEAYQRMQKAGQSWRALPSTFGCFVYRQAPDLKSRQRHYDAGIALSELYCTDYFNRIGLRKQKRGFMRSAVNDVGTGASALAGLLDAGSVATGALGAAFGLADRLFVNYDEAFVVEPDLGKMESIVDAAQLKLLSQHDIGQMRSYAQVSSAIQEYSHLCSFTGMAMLLGKALEDGVDGMEIESRFSGDLMSEERVQADREERRARLLERKLLAMRKQRELQDQIDSLESASED